MVPYPTPKRPLNSAERDDDASAKARVARQNMLRITRALDPTRKPATPSVRPPEDTDQ